ncbi:putative AT-hook motif nuclear-localized protein [Helianthus anomalus]
MITTSGGERVKILQLSDERRIEPSNQVPLKIPATPVRLFHNFIIGFFFFAGKQPTPTKIESLGDKDHLLLWVLNEQILMLLTDGSRRSMLFVCLEVGVSSSVGARFVPHIINVHTGEDMTMKVMSFSQHGPCAICILSANGGIRKITCDVFLEIMTPFFVLKGRFEILSLAGSFIPSESG